MKGQLKLQKVWDIQNANFLKNIIGWQDNFSLDKFSLGNFVWNQGIFVWNQGIFVQRPNKPKLIVGTALT